MLGPRLTPLKATVGIVQGESRSLCDVTHRDWMNGIVPGDDKAHLAVGHDDVAAFAGDVVTQLGENPQWVLNGILETIKSFP